ncbi:FadR/GntR family transcriptional regulator [Spirabiliibacterium falconis]|uniref:FadR/GntR family transcriptional regulator n=1 Tax=Spirabiliibacterium falconis TaxID=572023 RepID=UPI001AADC92B|nr:FCD domain-containing protein [Spirabiliibacterium falconis]MBE2894726.1 FadR family transcriptional regulator [Spirabiliibacterium falconis]
MLKSNFIAKRILNQIITGKYEANTPLPGENELCLYFGVSRTSIRTALQSIARKKVITIQPKKSSVINPIEEWDWLDNDILELFMNHKKNDYLIKKLLMSRLIFEPNICVQAAMNRDQKDISKIELGLNMMKSAVKEKNRDLFLKGDNIFHNNIIKACKNPFLSSLNNMLTTSMQITFNKTLETDLQKSLPAIERHEELLISIKNQNYSEAKAISKQIILTAIEKNIKDQDIMYIANYL